MRLPDHTQRLVERSLRSYCARICPPSFTRQVRLGWEIEGLQVTLFELKPLWWDLDGGSLRREPLASCRYRPHSARWELYLRGPSGWQRYKPFPAARAFIDLLREIDADPHGVFWDRVNGASLRWCSSRGRCADCDDRYARILGNDDSRTPCES